MDSTALLTVGVAVVLLFIFMTGLCLNCKGNSQPTYIRQQQSYDPRHSYALNTGFTVVRSCQLSQHQIANSPSMPIIRPPSASPSSDGGSQSDYVNQEVDKPSYQSPPDKTPDDPDYLDVLPDDQNVSQQNHASLLNSGQRSQHQLPNSPSVSIMRPPSASPSSDGGSQSDYVNQEDQKDDENNDDSDGDQYINVPGDREPIAHTPVGSFGSSCSDGQSNPDYVNAPENVNFHIC